MRHGVPTSFGKELGDRNDECMIPRNSWRRLKLGKAAGFMRKSPPHSPGPLRWAPKASFGSGLRRRCVLRLPRRESAISIPRKANVRVHDRVARATHLAVQRTAAVTPARFGLVPLYAHAPRAEERFSRVCVCACARAVPTHQPGNHLGSVAPNSRTAGARAVRPIETRPRCDPLFRGAVPRREGRYFHVGSCHRYQHARLGFTLRFARGLAGPSRLAAMHAELPPPRRGTEEGVARVAVYHQQITQTLKNRVCQVKRV